MNDIGLSEKLIRVVVEAILLAVCCAVFGHVVAWTAEVLPSVWIGTVAGVWSFIFGAAAVWMHRRNMI